MDVDCGDAPDDTPFELTELDQLTLADNYARALALADARAQASDAYASDDSDNGSLGIDDPDLLDIPPPMTYEAWSVDEMECGAEYRGTGRLILLYTLYPRHTQSTCRLRLEGDPRAREWIGDWNPLGARRIGGGSGSQPIKTEKDSYRNPQPG